MTGLEWVRRDGVGRWEAEAGSSAAVVDRGIYDYGWNAPDNCSPNNYNLLSWLATPGTGLAFDLLDLADPKNPTVNEAGVYAVMATLNATARYSGKAALISLFLDTTAAAQGYETAVIPLDGADYGSGSKVNPQGALTAIWYCPAGAVLNAAVNPNTDDPSDWFLEAIVQRLSGAA